MPHCRTCQCDDWADARERERLAREAKEKAERELREFAARHSVLSDADVAWARANLPGNRKEAV